MQKNVLWSLNSFLIIPKKGLKIKGKKGKNHQSEKTYIALLDKELTRLKKVLTGFIIYYRKNGSNSSNSRQCEFVNKSSKGR
jgi:hypothetical protein